MNCWRLVLLFAAFTGLAEAAGVAEEPFRPARCEVIPLPGGGQ